MNLEEKLGRQIQLIRKKQRMTQEQLAKIIGVDPKSISKIEKGNNYPSPDNLEAIARVLGVSVYEFFLFEETKSVEMMKNEIINAINRDHKTLMYLYHMLKVL